MLKQPCLGFRGGVVTMLKQPCLGFRCVERGREVVPFLRAISSIECFGRASWRWHRRREPREDFVWTTWLCATNAFFGRGTAEKMSLKTFSGQHGSGQPTCLFGSGTAEKCQRRLSLGNIALGKRRIGAETGHYCENPKSQTKADPAPLTV